MAKKKQPEPETVRVSVINLKGSPEFRDWLSSASRDTHIPAAVIVRLGLEAWAKKMGRPAPPEI